MANITYFWLNPIKVANFDKKTKEYRFIKPGWSVAGTGCLYSFLPTTNINSGKKSTVAAKNDVDTSFQEWAPTNNNGFQMVANKVSKKPFNLKLLVSLTVTNFGEETEV